jgi:hypothetical protein
MQEQHLFEYAVIRWVPQVERDEFVNIGVILYCSRKKDLSMTYHLDTSRLAAFNPLFDLQELELHLTVPEQKSEDQSLTLTQHQGLGGLRQCEARLFRRRVYIQDIVSVRRIRSENFTSNWYCFLNKTF